MSDDSGLEPRTPAVAGPQGPAGPAGTGYRQATAITALADGAVAKTVSGGVSLASGGGPGSSDLVSGVVHPAALITATANIYGSGSRCPIAGLPVGVLYRSNTGTLVVYGSLVVGERSIRMGVSDGAGFDVLVGEEFEVT